MLWNDLCFKPLQAGLYNGTLMLYNIRSTEHDFLLDSRYVGVPDMAAGIMVFTKHNLNVSVCVFGKYMYSVCRAILNLTY